MTDTCTCGKGKVSRWNGKCGHCRSRTDQKRKDDGWSIEEAIRGFRTKRKPGFPK